MYHCLYQTHNLVHTVYLSLCLSEMTRISRTESQNPKTEFAARHLANVFFLDKNSAEMLTKLKLCFEQRYSDAV